MLPSLRTAFAAVVTTALVLSIPAASLAAPATAPQGVVASTDTGTAPRQYSRTEATEVFNRLQTALAPKPAAHRTLGNPLPRTDVTLLMRDAEAARGSMTARQASIIDSGRPVSDGAGCTKPLFSSWEFLASAHFCVHYRPTLTPAAGGATEEQAITTSNTMEEVYAKEVTGLGFNTPLADHDGKTDVFLDQLGDQRYYGFCKADVDSTATRTAWCGLDNDFAVNEFGAPPLNSLRVTAAHEFFHAIQFGYDTFEDDWFMEGTAVWMEDQVYPSINDYLQYLPDSQIVKPLRSSDSPAGSSMYGAVTFWKYLSERFHNVNIIRDVWNSARVSAGSRGSIAAVAAVLKSKGSSLPVEFARYGVWNTLPPGTYADRSYFPAPGIWAAGTLRKGSRDTGLLSVKVNHLATAPLVLRAGTSLPARTRLTVTLDGPNTSRGTQARIQLRYKSGKVVFYSIRLNASGNGTRVIPFNPAAVKSAIVTMSNGSAGYNAQLFKVRAKAKY